MESIQSVKQRFGIIGNNNKLNRALEKSIQVSNSDISVLVTGESGVGKTSGGRSPVSPWGQSAKGLKTRRPKRSDKLIITRRKKRK